MELKKQTMTSKNQGSLSSRGTEIKTSLRKKSPSPVSICNVPSFRNKFENVIMYSLNNDAHMNCEKLREPHNSSYVASINRFLRINQEKSAQNKPEKSSTTKSQTKITTTANLNSSQTLRSPTCSTSSKYKTTRMGGTCASFNLPSTLIRGKDNVDEQ